MIYVLKQSFPFDFNIKRRIFYNNKWHLLKYPFPRVKCDGK
jgi:hypothetical protein